MAARILIATFAVTMITGVAVLERTANWTAREMLRKLSALDSPEKRRNIAACEADPAGFAAPGPSGATIHAYDVSTGRSANPAAPPLDEDLWARVREVPEMSSRVLWGDPEWGGVALDPVAATGPCSAFQIRWPRGDSTRRRGFVTYFSGVSVVVALGLLLAFVFAVRPSVRRLNALEARSRAVGLDDDFAPEPPPVDDAIGRLSTTLTETHTRLVAAAEAEREQQAALRRHLAQIAHDLRTPLSSSQLALEQSLAADGGDREALLKVLDDMVYMDALTNNLHLASRLEHIAGPLDAGRQVDIAQVVDFVVTRFRILGRRHDIEVSGARPDEPLIVACDPAMAQQTVANLVHNAVVHGRAGGHVAVVLDEHDDGFELRVLDDGPGLSAAQYARLAGPAETSPGISTEGGLGVRIARAVAARAGWSMSFAPGEPEGLVVTIRGPRA